MALKGCAMRILGSTLERGAGSKQEQAEGGAVVTQEARELSVLRRLTWRAFLLAGTTFRRARPWAQQPSASKCERLWFLQSPSSHLHLVQNFFKFQELSIDLKLQRNPLIWGNN